MDLFDKCRKFQRAKELIQQGYYPYFRPISESRGGTEAVVNGRTLIMFGSNNYLGLTHHPAVQEAAARAIERYGTGCTGSRFLNGTLDLHEELEERLARFVGKEACLTFSTGFQANLGSIATLVGRDEVIFCDRENHASIFDGCRLSFGEVRKFRHNDMEDLERLLAREPSAGAKLIVVDGLFSMLGDLADLPTLVELARKYGARVLVDEAHAVGVMGPRGAGSAEHFGLTDEVDLILGTFSKSLASMGGFVAGPEAVIHYIKHHSRPLIFSASISPSCAATVLAALEVVETEPAVRAALWDNVDYMRRGLAERELDSGESRTPIQPIIVGDQMKTFVYWKRLYDAGVYVNPVISPAAPPGKDLIRTSTMATHTHEQIDRALDLFAHFATQLGIRKQPAPKSQA
ncbi:MAG: pyridoxal phosphate-dependent aminotransferase family protein [Planctomycetes bacterium]|nr:pyridoxal phosphate-dependent aminotransferase family protein [Planctomycetota bacterium]